MTENAQNPEPQVPDDLIRAACAGDEVAFGEVFKLLYPRVHRTVWGMLGSESEANDVAQDAWIKAWEKRERYNFQSQYTTWVHRIAVNTALDALRKRKRLRSRFISLFNGGNDPMNKSSGTAVQPLQDKTPDTAAPDPAERMRTTELGQTIEAAVNELPEAQRTVLVLREYEGYSYEEIANTLGIEPGTVMSRLYHARQKLQKSLSKELS